MKVYRWPLSLSFIIICIMSSCYIATPTIPPASKELTNTPLKLISLTPTSSHQIQLSLKTTTSQPTATPHLPFHTPTSTPKPGTLAYLKSFPILDINQMVTATHSPVEKCPLATSVPVNTPVIANFLGERQSSDEEFLTFLNTYGVEPLIGVHTSPGARSYVNPNVVAYQDFTNDGVPEIIVSRKSLDIFGCKNGRYELIFQLPIDAHGVTPKIIAISDLNYNSLPEIYLQTAAMTQGGKDFNGIEWDGDKFKWLLEYPDNKPGVFTTEGHISFEDIDKDNLDEIVVTMGIPVMSDYSAGLPWRNTREAFKWNGTVFMFFKRIYDPPVFRFQAVQDGDRATLLSEYDRALDLYQQAIFSDRLDWYSRNRHDTMVQVWFGNFENTPTPTLPSPDPFEYENLAAYARYRIMLLHVAHNYISDARVVYETLQNKYPEGKPGHAYAAMAASFWNHYQTTHNMADACSQAIQYAQNYWAEIATYIGGMDYHGWQSLNYKDNPEFLCPFQ